MMKNRKCTKWPENDLERYEVKRTTHMYYWYPRVSNFNPFCSKIACFPDNLDFWFLNRVQGQIWNFENKSLRIENSKFQQEAHGPWRSAWEPTWPLAKVPHILLFYPRGRKWAYFTLRAEVSEIQADFQNFHIWAWNLAIGRSSTYTFFLPQGVEIEILALWVVVSEIRADFQNCHIWAWNLEFEKRARSCIWTLFLPQWVEIELIFALRTAVSEIRADFENYHIWAWNLEFEISDCRSSWHH